jgi:phosphoglycolate phosphatase
MIKALIFDFDGTVADTIPALCEGVNLTMRRHGYPEHTEDDIRRFINNGARMLIRRSMPSPDRDCEETVSRVLSDYNECYGLVYHHTEVAYEGVAELIDRLHRTYRIGVLSNKQDEFVKKLCRQVLLSGSYDAAQGAVEGHPTKPDPYLPLLVCKELGVAPEECLMIGDSDVDLRTAINAGMRHIGVTWGFRSEEFLRAAGVECLAHTPRELEEQILRMTLC